ncbi:MAG: hypothetical protein QNL04_13315 [SAR324 cluster bacterium]|nr:hypothetical protein [SAR324 cluster bacterium]
MQVFAGLDKEMAKAVAVSKPEDIEAILVASRFSNPVAFFIHAWYARSPVS